MNREFLLIESNSQNRTASNVRPSIINEKRMAKLFTVLSFIAVFAGFLAQNASARTASLSTDASLSALTVNSSAVAGFTSTTTSYDLVLPVGTTTYPTVDYSTSDVNASVSKTDDLALPGTSTIVVTAEDGITVATYTISFTVAKSTDATLKSLTVSLGSLSPAFASSTVTYTANLPAGTSATATVTVSALPTYSGATVSITQASSTSATATLVVTAEDGITQKTYTVKLNVLKSTDATLKSLTVSLGTLSPTFASGTLKYTVVLPVYTTTKPTVAAVANFSGAKVAVTQVSSTSGTASVIVTPESGASKTYSITFSVAKATDASLSSIKINGVALPGFNKDTLNYTYALPYSKTTPTVIAVATEINATVGASVNINSTSGSATIEVTAEDGKTKRVYSVVFTPVTSVTEASAPIPSIYFRNNNIVIEAVATVENVKIYNLAGVKVADVRPTSTETLVSTLNWNSGIYVVSLSTQTGTVSKKIAVVK